MLESLISILSYPFIQRALIVGLLVSAAAALLGVSLVLKRFAMIGDGLSHVGFGSLAIATALNATPLAVALPVVMLAAIALLRLSSASKIKGDAAIALISTGALAIGVTVVSATSGMNIDVTNYLFGSILAVSQSDVILSIVLAVVVLTLFVLFYNRIFAITFDENFARATGSRTGWLNTLIALLTALIIVLGMRLMGALLISSLIIFPALTAMRVLKTFRSVTICSICIAIICFISGIVVSYLLSLPTGSTIVLCNIAAFAIFWLVRLLLNQQSFKRSR
ncbi:MAG: metal ABC transporter permease [Coriobacteriales bacterium]|jgi:zinc transport system permease protein|nr:metal ABC transporter permease [Coriobacteriales bacterium]